MKEPAEDDGARRFGRYRVKKVIGRGGMGVVYLAEDPRIGRQVALKVIRANPDTPESMRAHLRKRFEVEAHSAGTLSHSNIVTIYDIGEEDDSAYIAMEYVRGESLEHLLGSERSLSFKEVSDLTAQLCRAIDYAHSHGVIHRDIKPANILLTPEGHPKIVDFGVAKIGEALGGDETRLTQAGSVIGTPAYMSPEQVTGHEVTAASDQFSLGVIVYEMLSGRVPFEGEGATTVMYKIVHEEPPALAEHQPHLPGRLDRVVLRALSKKPEDRYDTCADFAAAVRQALQAAPEEAERAPADATMLMPPEEPPADRTMLLDAAPSDATVLAPPVSSPTVIDVEAGPSPAPAAKRSSPIRIGMLASVLVVAAAVLALAVFSGGSSSHVDPAIDDGANAAVTEPAPAIAPPATSEGDETDADVSSDAGLAPSNGGGGPAAPPAVESDWWIEIAGGPVGAQIWVDGAHAGRVSPSELQVRGRRGDRVLLELRADGAVVATTEVELGPFMPRQWPGADAAAADPPAVTESLYASRLRIDAPERGASILVDGRDTGERTPAVVTLEGEVGDRFRVQVVAGGRTLGDRTFVLGPNMPSDWAPGRDRAFTADTDTVLGDETPGNGLAPAAGSRRSYTITSQPPGATVTIAGRQLPGTTPVEVELAPGERYQLRVELAGHETASWAFSMDDLSDGQRQSGRLHFPLAATTPPGRLRVVAGYDVQIRIDGRSLTAPAGQEVAVPAGRHAAVIEAPDVFLRMERTLEIPEGRVYELALPNAMPVQVAAAPGNCRVTIDGRAVDTTPFSVEITAGDHTFEFFWPALGKTLYEVVTVNRPGQRIFASVEGQQ